MKSKPGGSKPEDIVISYRCGYCKKILSSKRKLKHHYRECLEKTMKAVDLNATIEASDEKVKSQNVVRAPSGEDIESIIRRMLPESHTDESKMNQINPKAGLTEYEQYDEYLNDFLTRDFKKDPTILKKRSEELCHEYFPYITEQFSEMADYVLVEPMDGSVFLSWSAFAHINFKAKHKDAADSSVSVYFAEVDLRNHNVMCLSKIDTDLSGSSHDRRCFNCHPAADGGYVYHPSDDGTTWIGNVDAC